MSGLTNGSARSGPPYGYRLIPHIVDGKAKTVPDQECFSVPRSCDPEDGWRAISWKQFANGVNHVAHMIIETCGTPAPGSFPTLAYIGPNDVRYALILLACVQSRRQIFIPLPTNTPAGQASLLKTQGCATVFAPKESMASWDEALTFMDEDTRRIEVPSISHLLGEHKDHVEEYPYERTEEQGLNDTYMIIQTSGKSKHATHLKV